MPVDDPTVIDVASINLNGDAVLTISDHLEWSDDSDHLFILQSKINVYLSAIESGDFQLKYPLANGRNIIINIVAKHEPNVMAKSFLAIAKTLINSAGFGFEFKVLDG